ncbi:MAG TPA: hypothetical protein VMU96_04735, partial [Casimicrobiaceae bacterium]|nr:hypothetical protein [Casimicrobiaceae bacterium]
VNASKQPKVKKAPLKVVLDREQRLVLDEIAHAMTYPYRDVIRARMILLLADGVSQAATLVRNAPGVLVRNDPVEIGQRTCSAAGDGGRRCAAEEAPVFRMSTVVPG